MSVARSVLWRVFSWILFFGFAIPVYMGIDAVVGDGFVKEALQWTIGAILVTVFLGIRPPSSGKQRPRRRACIDADARRISR